MPSSLTSSFASAAAGGNLDNNSNRRDGSGINEWSRTRPNGATQTFRRTSQVNTQSRDNLQSGPTPVSTGPYIPPHINQQASVTRNGVSGDMRYSKEQLLSIYQNQKDSGTLNRNLRDLFQGPWPVSSQVLPVQNRTENKEQNMGPEICWNSQAETDPFGLVDMTDAEKQFFSSSVNSTLKPNHNKETGVGAASNRKSSMSSHHGTSYNVTNNSSSRPVNRRRETSDSYATNGPLSPSEPKSSYRTDPGANTPPAQLRRRNDHREDDTTTEMKDEEPVDYEAQAQAQAPFGSLRRLATGPLSAGINNPSASPWSAGGSRSAFDSMGGFGHFNVGPSQVTQDSEKRPGFGSARGNSRFKDLLQKTSSEEVSSTIREKSSIGSLEKLPEEENQTIQSRTRDNFKTRPYRSETNPYEYPIPRTGSAALSQDEQIAEQSGFVPFNPTETANQATPGIRRAYDALSPTNTNPYHSPAAHRGEEDEGDETHGPKSAVLPLGNGRRDVFTGSSQSAAFGSSRAPLGGLGGLPGWGGPVFGSGTPGRDRNAVSSAFGDPIFSPIADLQSPGGSFFGSSGFNSAGRPNRLEALFPPAMQDQMRSDSRNDAFDTPVDNGGTRDPFESSARRQDGLRSLFEDGTHRPVDGQFASQPGITLPGGPNAPAQRASTGPEQASGHGPSPSGGSSSSHTLPTAQQRQMVMPDRMRWIYRDPQGNVQGPWSGLEMHDWFKAGFFTAELQVKKLEDAEYEPLAQLVRRIGNSREPFLVPQIGVPHGPPSANQGNQWANTMGAGGAQPPFANSFPSFGTTLTAEQQNALERRKQEEQYLMARQKEHLAQQQMYMKQMQIQNPSSGVHGLQHHSSAHSLQSQPSFGSITSPGGYQPSPMQAPIQPPQAAHGFGPARQLQQQVAREDDLSGRVDRMSFSQRANAPFGQSSTGQQPLPSQSQGHTQDGGRTLGEQNADVQAHEEAFLGRDGRNERLEEFQSLREDLSGADREDHPSFPQSDITKQSLEEQIIIKRPTPIGSAITKPGRSGEAESLSLTQQVQRTAAANEKAAAHEQYIEPPPTSISPLPAPTPNRNRQHVADHLAAESRSQSQTPVEPASVAPWAQAEMPKGPSLKEIQEAEAKRAAENEALLAASRRAQAEQERVAAAAAAAVVIPAPGLPASSNWASSTSPASPGPALNVWGSKQVVKPITGNTNSKKTLAQIQKEEEAKKQKAAAQAAQAQTNTAYTSGAIVGKKYAELAGKVITPTTQGAHNSWIPVGSGGKPKTPATVVAAPQGSRAVSASAVPTAAKSRPVLQTRTTSISNKSKADEEFVKWARLQLGNELNAGLNPDAFIRELLMLPADKEILREALYANSQTINGDRVSEEWIRRRKLADKGIIEPATDTNSPISGDNKNAGWSEVAKKNPIKEDSGSAQAFKVVSKKKGKK